MYESDQYRVHLTIFDKSNTRGLRTNQFTSLYEDKDGTLWAGTGDGGLTLYRNGVFNSYTPADGMPGGQVFGFSHDLKGELLIGIGSGQFYMREGRFISAPPEYQAQDMKLYLAPSEAQWTITTNGAKQVRDGRVTQYPMKLSFAYGVWPYEDSLETCGWATGQESTGCGTVRPLDTWNRTACRCALFCAHIVKTTMAASGLPQGRYTYRVSGWLASKTGGSPSTERAAG